MNIFKTLLLLITIFTLSSCANAESATKDEANTEALLDLTDQTTEDENENAKPTTKIVTSTTSETVTKETQEKATGKQETTTSRNTSEASTSTSEKAKQSSTSTNTAEASSSSTTSNEKKIPANDTLRVLTYKDWTPTGTKLSYGETAYIANAHIPDPTTVGVTVTEVIKGTDQQQNEVLANLEPSLQKFYKEYDLYLVKGTVQHLGDKGLNGRHAVNVRARGKGVYSRYATTPDCIGFEQKRSGLTFGVTESFCHAFLVDSPTGSLTVYSPVQDINFEPVYWQ